MRALTQSLNLPTVNLGLEVGLARVARAFVQLGLDEKPAEYPSMLLGATNLSPFQVAQLYNTLAEGEGGLLITSATIIARFKLELPEGARVAVQTDKSVEALMLYLGVLRAGFVSLPLNTAYQRGELEYFLKDAEPSVVVCTPERYDELRRLATAAGCSAREDAGRAPRWHPARRRRAVLRRLRDGAARRPRA